MTRYRGANALATLPFDRIDHPFAVSIHDDMLGVETVADLSTGAEVQTAVAQYFGAEIAGAAVSNVTAPAATAGHVGVLQLNAGSTTAADGDAAYLQFGGGAVGVQQDILLDTNGIYVATMIQSVDSSADKFEFGLTGQEPVAVNGSPLDLVTISWDPDDSTAGLICKVAGNGTDIEEIGTIAPTDGDWFLLEIAATSTDATFRITTDSATETINLTGEESVVMPVVALRPFWAVENVGAAEATLPIDLFHLRYLRRGENAADNL